MATTKPQATKRTPRKKQTPAEAKVIPKPSTEQQEVTKGRYVVLETLDGAIHKGMTVKMITDFIKIHCLDGIPCGLVRAPCLLSKFYFQVCVRTTLENFNYGTLDELTQGQVLSLSDNPSMLEYWAEIYRIGNIQKLAERTSIYAHTLPLFTAMHVCEEIPTSSIYDHVFVYDCIEKTVVHLKLSKPFSQESKVQND